MLNKNYCIYIIKNFKIDYNLLSDTFNTIKNNLIEWRDLLPHNRIPRNIWKTIEHDFPYANLIKKKLNIDKFETKTKFYIQSSNSDLIPHTDMMYNVPTDATNTGTTCALNFLLTKETAPVTFYDVDPVLYENSSPEVREQMLLNIKPQHFTYKKCLLNTALIHRVKNIKKDRILFRISIKNQPFEKIRDIIKSADKK